jgi:HAD superfamily hydrolase (TIGR01509 family)
MPSRLRSDFTGGLTVSPHRYEAVLFDALGTLVRLEPPWPLLAGTLASRYRIEISEHEAREAIRAEMTYYLEHHTEGRDPVTLAELRARCAAILGDALPEVADRLTSEELTEVLLESLRFVPFPDAATSLGALRALGVRSAVVSNWDCSLGGLLAGLGLGGLLDGIVTSAEAGFRKPDPRIFEAALTAVQCEPERALFVGDSLNVDVAGGRAAGIRSVLIDRTAAAPEPGDVERIFTLDNLPALMSGSPIV